MGLQFMSKSLIAGAVIAWGSAVSGEPVDMTGLACDRIVSGLTQTWECYGDVAIAYFPDGSVDRLTRMGVGAYEKYDQVGQWVAAFYFFDTGDGLQVRVLAKPGLLVREENPTAPLEKGFVVFRDCIPISEK